MGRMTISSGNCEQSFSQIQIDAARRDRGGQVHFGGVNAAEILGDFWDDGRA